MCSPFLCFGFVLPGLRDSRLLPLSAGVFTDFGMTVVGRHNTPYECIAEQSSMLRMEAEC